MAVVKTLPLDYELVVYSGTTFRREFRWLPDGSAALDFFQWTASLKMGIPLSRTPLVTLTTENSGIILSTSGQIILQMTPVQTAALPAGVITYSLDLIDSGGNVLRFLRGRLSVITDVGRST